MIDRLKKVIQKLEKSGRYVEIHLEESFPTVIGYSGKEMETISDSSFFAGNIRIFEKGYWSVYSFNNLNIDLLEKEGERMIRTMGFLEKRPGELPHCHKIEDSIETEYEKNPKKYSLEERNSIIRNYNELLGRNKKITTTRSIYKDVRKKLIFLNSEGSYITQEKTFTGFSVYGMAREGTNVQQAFFSNAGYGGMELVEGREEEVERVTRTALDLLSAKPAEKGRYNVILDPWIAGVFAHEAFGHLSEADHVYENEGMLQMMKLGRTFGKETLNIIDDGSLKGLAGYTPYDDEGIPGNRTHLIKNGKLVGRLHSRETARKMGEELTGNARALNPMGSPLVRMTNTFIDNGSETRESLFEKLGDGIYCADYIGGMTNLEMFTFTPARAYRVENGKVKELLRDVVLSGNVFETLHQIEGIGNDLQHFGTLGGCGKGGQSGLPVTIGAPHVLIKDVLIG
jgi:TldD protein